ncbi:MAG: hypothetical protein HYY93_09430 [Planctomycetes bacterium]|nr:hypothetical protein [Planctomycetota bacterium]
MRTRTSGSGRSILILGMAAVILLGVGAQTAEAQGPVGSGRCDVSSTDFPRCLCIRDNLLGATVHRESKNFTITLNSDQPHLLSLKLTFSITGIARFNSPTGADEITFLDRACPGTLPVTVAAAEPNHPGITQVIFWLLTAEGEPVEVLRREVVVTQYSPQVFFEYLEPTDAQAPSKAETRIAVGNTAAESFAADTATSRQTSAMAVANKTGKKPNVALAEAAIIVKANLRIRLTGSHCPDGIDLKTELAFDQASTVRSDFQKKLLKQNAGTFYTTRFLQLIGGFPGSGILIGRLAEDEGEPEHDEKTGVSAVAGPPSIWTVSLTAETEYAVSLRMTAYAYTGVQGKATCEFDAGPVTLGVRLISCPSDQ